MSEPHIFVSWMKLHPLQPRSNWQMIPHGTSCWLPSSRRDLISSTNPFQTPCHPGWHRYGQTKGDTWWLSEILAKTTHLILYLVCLFRLHSYRLAWRIFIFYNYITWYSVKFAYTGLVCSNETCMDVLVKGLRMVAVHCKDQGHTGLRHQRAVGSAGMEPRYNSKCLWFSQCTGNHC